MARPRHPYIRAELKVSIPAALLAELDLMLLDPITQKPRYSARSTLIATLLTNWVAKEKGRSEIPVPSLDELLII